MREGRDGTRQETGGDGRWGGRDGDKVTADKTDDLARSSAKNRLLGHGDGDRVGLG